MKKLIYATKKHPEGFTMKRNGVYAKPKTGYFVALTDNRIKRVNKKTLSPLKSQAKQLEKMTGKEIMFGYWKDEQEHCLDLSIHTKNLGQAKSIGKLFKQKAIYSCKKQDSIYL